MEPIQKHITYFQTYAANEALNAQNNNDASIASTAAAMRKDRSDSLKENEEDQPSEEEEHRKKRTNSKPNTKRPLNHSLSAPVFPGYEATASEPSLAASWMIDHQPVSWSPGMMRTHAAGVRDLFENLLNM